MSAPSLSSRRTQPTHFIKNKKQKQKRKKHYINLRTEREKDPSFLDEAVKKGNEKGKKG